MSLTSIMFLFVRIIVVLDHVRDETVMNQYLWKIMITKCVFVITKSMFMITKLHTVITKKNG